MSTFVSEKDGGTQVNTSIWAKRRVTDRSVLSNACSFFFNLEILRTFQNQCSRTSPAMNSRFEHYPWARAFTYLLA